MLLEIEVSTRYYIETNKYQLSSFNIYFLEYLSRNKKNKNMKIQKQVDSNH